MTNKIKRLFIASTLGILVYNLSHSCVNSNHADCNQNILIRTFYESNEQASFTFISIVSGGETVKDTFCDFSGHFKYTYCDNEEIQFIFNSAYVQPQMLTLEQIIKQKGIITFEKRPRNQIEIYD